MEKSVYSRNEEVEIGKAENKTTQLGPTRLKMGKEDDDARERTRKLKG